MEIIAEIGQNHNGDMGLARELINAAKDCGADVAKFQLYDARDLFPKKDNQWFEYNCKAELSRKELSTLKMICDDVHIEFLTSVFDVERISWCEEISVKRYKIASRSVSENKLIDALIETKKPLLMSLGMWHEELFPVLDSEKIDFLYCISKYPTPLEEIRLGDVDFSRYAGFSDHSIGITAACAAFCKGAKIIEKHFTLDRDMYGPDHRGSMEPDELSRLAAFRDDLGKCL